MSLGKEAVQAATSGALNHAVADNKVPSTGDSVVDKVIEGMAEGVILAAAWFTVRMICQVSYKAIKSYRDGKTTDPQKDDAQGEVEFSPAYSGGGGGSGSSFGLGASTRVSSDTRAVPWDPAENKTSVVSGPVSKSLGEDDREWVEELRRASNANTRDNARLFEGIKDVENKVDKIPLEALYDKLRHGMRLLLEYQQNPSFRNALKTLGRAEAAIEEVYTNERSLVMNLSALRIRIVITYLHPAKHSKGLTPSMDDKAADKGQCELYVRNALKQGALEELCRTFLGSQHSDDRRFRERVELETTIVFNIILEVLASVYMLEPFRPSEGPLPKDSPEVVLHALSAYCQSEIGQETALLYTDLAQALKDWRCTPERQEKMALRCLYRSTNGQGWACNEGWDKLFDGPLSSLYGVSTENGRVTKICLGANDLEGRLPPELEKLHFLQELSLPGNKLYGKIPQALWELPCLRVVALQKNDFTVTPPERFRPASSLPAAAGGNDQKPRSQRRCFALHGTVEACHPGRIEVFNGEWFTCSWKITNTGRLTFPKETKLSRAGYDKSAILGAEDIMVNPLRPGEEQIVHVMQQAPKHEAWCQDEWALVGEGLDFVAEDEAKAYSPHITVILREHSTKSHGMDVNAPTLANTVFVAAMHRRHGSSHSSSHSGQFAPPPYFSLGYSGSGHT